MSLTPGANGHKAVSELAYLTAPPLRRRNISHQGSKAHVLLKRVWTSSKCMHTLFVLSDMITNPLRLMVPAPWAGFCFFKVHCHNKSLETSVKRQTLRPRTVFNRLRHDAVDSLPFIFLAEMLIFLYAPLWHVFQEIHECICGFAMFVWFRCKV